MTANRLQSLALCLAAVVALGPRPAAAQTTDPGYRKEWPEEVPRFHWAEYATTGALLGGSLALRFGASLPEDPNVTGGLPGEEAIFEALYPKSDRGEHAWTVVGDIPFYTSFAWSSLEPAAVAIAGGIDLGSQLFLMNLEGLTVTAAVLWTSQLVVRRRRPTDRPCDDPTITVGRDDRCDDPETIRGFIGGHTAVVATSATLTCIHHAELSLWGGGIRDAVPCGLWVAGTLATFSSRTVTGSHYLSDNLLGLGLGVAAGLVPWSLHYARRDRGPRPPRESPLMPRVVGVGLTPSADGTGPGVIAVHGVLP